MTSPTYIATGFGDINAQINTITPGELADLVMLREALILATDGNFKAAAEIVSRCNGAAYSRGFVPYLFAEYLKDLRLPEGA